MVVDASGDTRCHLWPDENTEPSLNQRGILSQGQARDGFWSWTSGGVGESVVRPVGLAISPLDGALYVSSDNRAVEDQPGKKAGESQGAIYRIAAVAP